EAQTLSYLYYKNNFVANPKRTIMKRIWTNPVFYRNVAPADTQLAIWHLPSEKTYGLATMYEIFVVSNKNYGLDMNDEMFLVIIKKSLGIPHLTALMKMKYYSLSY